MLYVNESEKRQWDQFEIFMQHPKEMELKTNHSMNVTNLNILHKVRYG